MSAKEYHGWIQYFKQRPYQWRDDHRASIISQVSYQGKDPFPTNELFPSLKTVYSTQSEEEKIKDNTKKFNNLLSAFTKGKMRTVEDIKKEEKKLKKE